MKLSVLALTGVGVLVFTSLVLGFVAVRPALAQVHATSTDTIVDASTSVDAVSDSTTPPATETETAVAARDTSSIEGSTDTTEIAASDSAQIDATTGSAPSETTQMPASTESTISADGQVEVQLLCSRSYPGPLYDTSSGHLDNGYFVGARDRLPKRNGAARWS
jgi:hypothetical protein